MKVLEEYFRGKGISNEQYGIVCPQGNRSELRYWRKDTTAVVIDNIDLKCDQGMFCFRFCDGVIEVI